MAGDFIYRNQISSDYDNVGVKTVNTHHPFAVMDTLCCAIFATDLDPVSWEDEFARTTKGYPADLLQRGHLQSDHPLRLGQGRPLFGLPEPRHPWCGHQYCDRSHFSLYGLGRFWSIYHYGRQVHEQYLPPNRSVLLADGQGPSVAEAKCVSHGGPPAGHL